MRTLLICLMLSAPAFAEDASRADTTADPRPVASEIVSLASATRPSFVGIVAARTKTDLGFPVKGTVASRPVEVGDILQAGALIAQLDPEDLDADLRASEAGVLVAKAQQRSAKDAQERARDLVTKGVDADTRLEDALRQLAAAEARLEQAEASFERARDLLGYATLKAPQDGVITQVFAEPGATLEAGATIVTLAGTDAREIVLDLTEQDVAALDVGAKFEVQLLAGPDVTTTATLYRINPVTERSTRTKRLHLTLQEPGPGFRLGALVNVKIAAESEASLSIPQTAILDSDTGPSVWVIDSTMRKAMLRPVDLGQIFGERVRVLGGLSAGDEILVKGIHSLKEGQIVGPSVSP